MKNHTILFNIHKFIRIVAISVFLASFLFIVLIDDSFAYASQLKSPKRGFISSQPGKTWQQGLLSGNGTIGANVLSRPLDETIIFTHERLFLPKGPRR